MNIKGVLNNFAHEVASSLNNLIQPAATNRKQPVAERTNGLPAAARARYDQASVMFNEAFAANSAAWPTTTHERLTKKACTRSRGAQAALAK